MNSGEIEVQNSYFWYSMFIYKNVLCIKQMCLIGGVISQNEKN